MNVLAYDLYPNGPGRAIVEYVTLDELYPRADVITLHCNLTLENTGMINKDSIAKMKDGVILINNARGQLIDEQDVADALNCGKMAAAGLDVVYTEPIRADNPLLKAKNCIITPHISWAPKESRQRIMDTSAARCISITTFSLLCPNPRSKLWQKCSRRSTPRRAKRRPVRRRKPLVAELRAMKLKEAAKKVEDGIEETLTYCDFPSEHWTHIRTNNVIERLNREICRRTRVVGTFPDGNSALMLVCARLRHVAGTQWGSKKYMNMKHLEAVMDDASIAG